MGQAFSFGCEGFSGDYGRHTIKSIYESLKDIGFNGVIEIYSGNVPAWSSDFCVGVLPRRMVEWEEWKPIIELIKSKVDSEIRCYMPEHCRRENLQASMLLYNGMFTLSNGKVTEVSSPLPLDSHTLFSCFLDDNTLSTELENEIKKLI